MTLGVAGVLTAHNAPAGAALVGAIAVKVSAALAIPFAVLAPTGQNAAPGLPLRSVVRLLAGAGLAALVIGGAAWVGFGWDWLHAFTLAGENQGRTSHLSIPITTARLLSLDPHTVRIAFLTLYAIFVAYLLIWTYQGADWLRAAAWATTGLLIATAWLLPWYLLWPLPLAALSRDRPLKLLLLAMTAYQLGARIPL
jgi:hypothetical protein